MIRAGSRALLFFAHPLNAMVLRAHAGGRLRPGELDEAIGWAASSSLRVAVGRMCDLGILARVEIGDQALSVATELTQAGDELLLVADALERWLRSSPDGPVRLEDPAARGTVRVLTAGWDSTMVRALAERPLTLTELNTGIPYISYPGLKRRLAKLRATHLVAAVGTGKSAAYTATEWLRQAVVPLAVAGRWELLYDADAEPITEVEVEAAFLLTTPLVELPQRFSGDCTLAVLTPDQAEAAPQVAGVVVEVEGGKVVSCRSESPSPPTTWVLGATDAWLEAVIEGRVRSLRVSGAKPRMAKAIVKGIHETLFVA